MNLLDSWEIEYETQKTFDNCRNKRKLLFDFYIKDANLLIEYDGEQHYFPVRGGMKQFNITNKNDYIKDLYCLNNNINLLRIPYYKKDDIPYILFDNLLKYGLIESI